MTTKDDIMYAILVGWDNIALPMTLSNIARKSGVSYNYVSRVCKKLERKGVIEVYWTNARGKVYRPNPKYGMILLDFMRRYKDV